MTDFPDTIAPLTISTGPAVARGYAELTQDYNPIHLDEEFARSTAFGRPIAHGTMALNLVVEAVTRAAGGAFYIADLDIRFTAPTYVGQTLTAVATRQSGAEYVLETSADDGRVVLKGTARLAMRVSE